jgi:glycosyltransferase involved in cell wall biosynthesis
MVVVPNSIDTAAYRAYDPSRLCARRCELLGGRVGPVVVSVGSLGPAKGHEYLVDAAARLVGQRGGRFRGLRVVIVGRDRDSGPLVRQRIAAWGLEDRVVLGGECADIATTLAAADLFVDPSVWQGLSLAVLEAMAAGVPVVATAVGEMPRLLEHGRLARLVPPGDPDALAEAMGELLDSPVLAREMAELAREYVQSAHEAASWTRQLEAIYARAVHEPGTQLSLP